MDSVRDFRIRTDCSSCKDKCCSRPYDWVFLTKEEQRRLAEAGQLRPEDFSEEQRNPATGKSFRVLKLPCRFLAADGSCSVYDRRPLVCRLYPFYPDAMTGHVALLSVQCGEHLRILASRESSGWSVDDHAAEIDAWIRALWNDA